jgi:hypothetical protein
VKRRKASCCGNRNAFLLSASLGLAMYCRGLLLQGMCLVSLSITILTMAWSPQVAADNGHDGDPSIVVDARLDMTCLPPPPGQEPGIGPQPPCVLPQDLDPQFISPNPSGQAHLMVKDDDTAKIVIRLRGLAPDLVVTSWLAYFFPPGPVPDPIFAPIESGLPPVAGVAVPLAPTTAAFTEGLGREPNQFVSYGGRGRLLVRLDYNPLKPEQGPLRNEASPVTQAAAPVDSNAAQPVCCPNGFPVPRLQPIGASFLRVFDPTTGLQYQRPNGRPVLLRSPVPAVVIAIVVHIDATTHGISAGIPIPPIPDISATVGDHYTLGIFDLRALHL